MSRPKPSLRVYFVAHADGHRTGLLMRAWSSFFDRPPPAAYGATEEEVFERLAALLQERLVTTNETLERYLWTERFQTRSVRLDVHPATVIDKQPVIGGRRLPLRLSYAWSKMESGAFRVMLPRFSWWLILEDLDAAKDALAHAVAGALMGAEPAWLYDFRREGEEYVREWLPDFARSERGAPPPGASEDEELPTLRQVADEWVERAAKGRLERPIGAARLGLDGSGERSLLLVGPPGVGKTTEVRHLARALLAKRREDALAPKLWATSADRLLAGMIYVGMWQERVLALVDELAGRGDLLYVDRLGPLLRPQPDGASVADLLAPAVRAGELRLVAECTEAELVEARRQDPGFVELLERRLLPEPTLAWTLQRVRERAERGPKDWHPRALKRGLELLAAYRRDRAFPGKAFHLVEAFERDEATAGTLYPRDVEEAFARQTGLPLELISDRYAASVEQVAERLRQGVVGQDAACLQAARAIAPFKAGLNAPDRPLASLLFCGPTGVGKTELAKQMTRYLFGSEERLVRVDMSELGAPGAARRLLAAGRGVRSLAESVRRQPLSVVLFDEIEKAHPEAFDLLLGVLGEGRLTDLLGRFVDFRMTLIVMTSNLGVRETAPVGFGAEEAGADFLRAVRDHFRPEFVGRVDQLVPFRGLALEDVARIARLQLAGIAAREGLARRGIRLEISPAAERRLAELGYAPRYGARPLKQALEAHVVTPLAVRLAKDPALRDRTLRVGAEGEDADLHV